MRAKSLALSLIIGTVVACQSNPNSGGESSSPVEGNVQDVAMPMDDSVDVPIDSVVMFEEDFATHYINCQNSSSTTGCSNVQSGLVLKPWSTKQLGVKRALVDAFDFNAAGTIVLYYVVPELNGANYFSYIIRQEDESGNAISGYMLVERTNTVYGAKMTQLSDNEAQALISDYKSKVKVYSSEADAIYDVSGGDIAYQCAYNLPEVKKLFEHNPNDSHVYFAHGARVIPVPNKGNVFVHTPIWIMGDQAGNRSLDGLSHPLQFYRRALDVGNLCPPNCL